MTAYFVRSTTGLDTNDGLSWATAKATIRSAMDLAAAGDTVFVSQVHAEPTSTTKNWTSAGTPAVPVRILCVSDADGVPKALAKSAVALGGGSTNSSPGISGSAHVYGLELAYGAGAVLTVMGGSNTLDQLQIYEECLWRTSNSGSTTYYGIGVGSTSNVARSRMLWINTDLQLTGSAQRVVLYSEFTWRGGTLRAGGALSYLFAVGAQGRASPVVIDGVDLSGLGPMTDLVQGSGSTGRVTFRNCKFDPGWSGQLVQGVVDPGLRVEAYNCDSGDTAYNIRVAAFAGTIRADTAMVKSGGAEVDGVPVSWKIDTNANPTPGSVGLETLEFARKNTAVGVPVTVSVDILPDSGTLSDGEAWLDVQYLGTAGSTKSSFASSKSILGGAPIQASGAAWPAKGARVPQRLSVSITPQRAGLIQCRVVFAKPSASLYVDPTVQVT